MMMQIRFACFTSIEHATGALANPRNHRLDGCNLVVEHASHDAVRRGPDIREEIRIRKASVGGSRKRDPRLRRTTRNVSLGMPNKRMTGRLQKYRVYACRTETGTLFFLFGLGYPDEAVRV